MDMRDLRKVDVKSAVFSVPHSKGFVQMLTIRMLAHPCAGHFREHLVCVALISPHNAEPKASDCNTEAIPVLKLPQAIPASLRESAIIGMWAAGPLAFIFTHEHCRFATDHGPAT